MKDRWNREIEGLVRKAQTTDWEAVRIDWEHKISNAFNKLRNTEQAQELEQRLKQNVLGAEDSLKQSAQEAIHGKRLLEEKA